MLKFLQIIPPVIKDYRVKIEEILYNGKVYTLIEKRYIIHKKTREKKEEKTDAIGIQLEIQYLSKSLLKVPNQIFSSLFIVILAKILDFLPFCNLNKESLSLYFVYNLCYVVPFSGFIYPNFRKNVKINSFL